MPLGSFEAARPWAAAIRESVKLRRMPPWFADPRFGEFANDPRLTDDEISTIERWTRTGAVRGAPVTKAATIERALKPDLIISMPRAFRIPAGAIIDYQYVVLPSSFAQDRWIRAVNVRPRDRSVVHHAVLYVREQSSDWLREAKPGVPYAPTGDARVRSRESKEDILAIYTPGAGATIFPTGMAKKIPAGSDLVLQLHYTSGKSAKTDRTQVELSFYTGVPEKRIATLQMGRDDLRIPPDDASYHASVSGTMPQDALLISLFPHMHLRGAAFDFDAVFPDGRFERLLRVKPFHFDWQLGYVLKAPKLLPKGTRLRWTGYFDNSAKNPRNPDPSAEVTWGEQSFEEMMIGFFDVAIDPKLSKAEFFIR